jgi:hypothetical protein
MEGQDDPRGGMDQAMTEVFKLFPTPVVRIERVLDEELVAGLAKRFTANARQQNAVSHHLAHTEPVPPAGDPLYQRTRRLVLPHVAEFGEQLLGERLTWLVKEMWGNVLETGGRQSLHNHANSFVSGIVYLSASHASANTVFVKAPGGSDFVFNNTNPRAKLGPYNAGKWVSPDPSPGDLCRAEGAFTESCGSRHHQVPRTPELATDPTRFT